MIEIGTIPNKQAAGQPVGCCGYLDLCVFGGKTTFSNNSFPKPVPAKKKKKKQE